MDKNVNDERVKRYLLFMGVEFYPGFGWEDFVGAYDTIDEARKARAETRKADGFTQWWHIVDIETLAMIEQGEE